MRAACERDDALCNVRSLNVLALEKALAAKDRPGRELADKGRRAEAQALLQQVESKLK